MIRVSRMSGNGIKVVFIDKTDVVLIEANKKYLDIHTSDGKTHLYGDSLYSMADLLPETFLKVSRKALFNMVYFKEILIENSKGCVYQKIRHIVSTTGAKSKISRREWTRVLSAIKMNHLQSIAKPPKTT